MWVNPLKRFFNSQDPPPDSRPNDSYFEKLIRYIPGDIVAAYLTLDGVLRSVTPDPRWLPWAVFAVMFLLTPFYVVFMKTDPPGFAPSKNFHWMASLVAFTVYAFAIDGSFAHTFPWYNPVYGSVLLVLTTLIIPLAERLFIKLSPTTIPGTTPTHGPTPPPVLPSSPPTPPGPPSAP